MDTTDLTKVLSDKAIYGAESVIDTAAIQFAKALRLQNELGHSFRLTAKMGGEDVSIDIQLGVIFRQIRNQIIDERRDTIKTRAIQDFLKQFENYRSHIEGLAQYMEENQ